MLIPDDPRGYERVAILNEEAVEAHQPARGRLRRAAVAQYAQPVNLAAQAHVTVDSFYGTLNVARESELYPALNQVALEWRPAAEPGLVYLHLATATPNWEAFRLRFDGRAWRSARETVVAWPLHPGLNRVEACALNSAGRAGRIGWLDLDYRPEAASQTPWPASLTSGGSPAVQVQPPRTRFGWEDYRHPRLSALREKYGLEQVIAGASTDLERVGRLRDWVKSRWDHQQPIILPPWDALYILERVDKGLEAFYCVHYSITFMQCCLSLGIPARLVNLHRGIGPADLDRRQAVFTPADPPIDEHVVNEVWLDDQGRWAMMDVDFDIHYERDGQPLNALEIHRAVLADELAALRVCEGPLADKLKADERFYQFLLPKYYTHFTVFWRNDHLSDPNGPTQVLHWVDERTPPMVWWEGSDLRHRPHIIGPAVVAWPYALTTPRLTDGNVDTCWASEETPAPHWAELRWSAQVTFSQVLIDWAECWRRYWTTTTYQLQCWDGATWRDLVGVTGQPEAAVSRHRFPPVTTDRLRLWQPLGGGPAERPNLLWVAEIEVLP